MNRRDVERTVGIKLKNNLLPFLGGEIKPRVCPSLASDSWFLPAFASDNSWAVNPNPRFGHPGRASGLMVVSFSKTPDDLNSPGYRLPLAKILQPKFNPTQPRKSPVLQLSLRGFLFSSFLLLRLDRRFPILPAALGLSPEAPCHSTYQHFSATRHRQSLGWMSAFQQWKFVFSATC